MNNDINTFREGIFALNTRRFGSVAEIMIKKLYSFEESRTVSYDLFDPDHNNRIEVKFSRATKDNSERINEKNVIDQCLYASNLDNRSMCSDEVDLFSFDSNIQQVKTHFFDYLFYGLFFMDGIEIFGVSSEDIYSLPGYSDFQHAGNAGEGQFHLNNNTLDYHRDNCFLQFLTYEELFNLFLP